LLQQKNVYEILLIFLMHSKYITAHTPKPCPICFAGQHYSLIPCNISHVLPSSQGRISQLEEDLDEEHSSADRLMERLDKTKEQACFTDAVLCVFLFFEAKALLFHLQTFINFPATSYHSYNYCFQYGDSALHLFSI